MNSRVEIDFKIFNNQCEVKSVLKLVYMSYSIITWVILSLHAPEFVLMAGFFFLLTWISFSAISLDSLDKMLKTQPNSTCE